MAKWFKQNFTVAIIITLLAGYGAGAAYAAILKVDVERLKSDTQRMQEKIDGIPERLGRIEEGLKNINKQLDQAINRENGNVVMQKRKVTDL